MNDYFIWKKESSNYNNIIVTNLPAITKPPIRTESIEIDGRDGDITNILGYSSYIKTLGIAFKNSSEDYFNNRLDYICNWLNGEGEIIFSNEPDKYYKGIILNQIDYEKALRFRTANINIKVQPFKYSLQENKIIKTSPYEFNNQCYLDILPVITLTGSGLIHLIINNIEVCQVTINERITIDSVLQEAYKDNTNNLANRNMLGNFPRFEHGKNIISWYGTGTVDQIETRYRMRWL